MGKPCHKMRYPALLTVPEDAVKKMMACLGCGRQMFTDRCHRICPNCRRRDNVPRRMAHGCAVLMPNNLGLKASLVNSTVHDGVAIEVLATTLLNEGRW